MLRNNSPLLNSDNGSFGNISEKMKSQSTNN